MKLDLSNQELNSTDIPRIIGELKQHPKANRLILAHNRLSDGKSLDALWTAIGAHGQIIAVDLSDNEIGLKGIAAIAAGLHECKILTRLNLSENQLGEKEIGILAKVISTHPAIGELNLENNKLEDSGITALISAIIGHPTLLSLNLKSNQFQKRGAEKLLHLFQQNNLLRQSGREIPFHLLEFDQEMGVGLSLYKTIQKAMYLYGNLPYRQLQLGKQISNYTRIMLEKTWEYTLLKWMIQFIKEKMLLPISEQNKPSLTKSYLEKMSIWRKELVKQVLVSLKDKCKHKNDQIFQIEQAEAIKKIDLLCQTYSESKKLDSWFNDSKNASQTLNQLRENIKAQHDAAMERRNPYIEELLVIEQEMSEITSWRLVMTPVIPFEGASSASLMVDHKVTESTRLPRANLPLSQLLKLNADETSLHKTGLFSHQKTDSEMTLSAGKPAGLRK